MSTQVPANELPPAVADALRRQAIEGEDERSQIVERLSWTPQERLDANTAFLRFYFDIRPTGPLLDDR